MKRINKIISGIIGLTLGFGLINNIEVEAVKTFEVSAKQVIFYKKNGYFPDENFFNNSDYSNLIENNGTKNNYTNTEFEMMCYVVQAEVGYCSQNSKIAVTNVILNRVKDSRFPNTIKGVLTQKNQFTSISNYYNKKNKPTQNTIDCVTEALNGKDNSFGALYFYNPKYCSFSVRTWFESLTFCFELDGQRYFKN